MPIYQRNQVEALITTTSLDMEHFNIFLADFAPIFNTHSPILEAGFLWRLTFVFVHISTKVTGRIFSCLSCLLFLCLLCFMCTTFHGIFIDCLIYARCSCYVCSIWESSNSISLHILHGFNHSKTTCSGQSLCGGKQMHLRC